MYPLLRNLYYLRLFQASFIKQQWRLIIDKSKLFEVQFQLAKPL